jgi:hypothetical protein
MEIMRTSKQVHRHHARIFATEAFHGVVFPHNIKAHTPPDGSRALTVG